MRARLAFARWCLNALASSIIGSGLAAVTADIVRLQRVETMLLGIIPTASQETVVVEPAGAITVTLVDQPPPEWLPAARLSSSAWLIQNVHVGASSPCAGRRHSQGRSVRGHHDGHGDDQRVHRHPGA